MCPLFYWVKWFTFCLLMAIDLKLIEKTREIVIPIIHRFNLKLIDIEYIVQKGRKIIRIIIDKDTGVTLDDCAKVSREIGYILDINDLFPSSYNLEVSSPGVERPLKTLNDFEKFTGRKIFIKTTELFQGRKNFKGCLKKVEGETIQLEEEKRLWELPFRQIQQAKLIYELPKKGLKKGKI
ncbi:MAG: ribosome maturation factor RimP [Desulfobacterota bacterium]|nr:ribosome maturation factor RimP [Thermodesulfobacteriota bacterium]